MSKYTGGIAMKNKVCSDIIKELNTRAVSDINFDDYNLLKLNEDISGSLESIEGIDQKDINTLLAVGIKMDEESSVGKFLLFGQKAFTLAPKIKGVEIIPIKKALSIYPEITKKYFFKAIDKNQDKFTKAVSETIPRGYFIRVKKGVIVEEPIHAGFFMYKEKSSMSLHNIVVLEEGAHLHLVTGCTADRTINGGLHITVSEHYIGKNAKLINTMVHNWGPEFIVRSRSATMVEENGTFVNNYYSVKPPRDIEMKPFTNLKGDNSTAKYMTVLVCLPGTYCDIGGTVLMTGEKSGAEIVARAVNHGGTVIQTGLLIGAAKDARAHVDCSGLMLNDSGIIEAVPGLRSMHPDAKMSHEAAIGKIDIGEVNYLQSKGLDEMQAISLIIRGFLDIGIEVEGLSQELEKTIKEISKLSGHGEEKTSLY